MVPRPWKDKNVSRLGPFCQRGQSVLQSLGEIAGCI
jgi:hypothetical protein